jgi:hypothetical protein
MVQGLTHRYLLGWGSGGLIGQLSATVYGIYGGGAANSDPPDLGTLREVVLRELTDVLRCNLVAERLRVVVGDEQSGFLSVVGMRSCRELVFQEHDVVQGVVQPLGRDGVGVVAAKTH